VRMADFNYSVECRPPCGLAILDQHENLHIRLPLEACHIRKQPLPLYRDKGSLDPSHALMTTF